MKGNSAGQRGGFVMGLVVGLLTGLALALGVALYITKAPIPFLNKVPLRTAEQDIAEAERNRTWDPNAPLGGKAVQRAAASAAAAAAAASAVVANQAQAAVAVGVAPVAPAAPPSRDPSAILAGSASRAPARPATPTAAIADPFFYFVQAGAYTRTEDAEQQRAKLAMLGQAAKITEREQAGRTVYRVRVGPFSSRDDADGLQNRLQEQNIEAQIVRVEKP